MARKVFVSILGTGLYYPCKYKKGNFELETRFIQEATIKLIGGPKWGADDRFIFFATEAAKRYNWDRTIEKRQKYNSQEFVEYTGLQKLLDDMGLTDNRIILCNIEEGKNEDEMWSIFSTLYDQLKDGDELYIDLTHSFRYIPMLTLVLCNYAKFLKGIKVKHISYGNYEASKETGIAPIVDLLPLSILQDWTFAAADLIRNGNVDQLIEMGKGQTLTYLFADCMTKKGAKQQITEYIDKLKVMIDNMKLCNGNTILTGEVVNEVNNYKINVDGHKDNIISVMPPIIDKIHETFSGFDEIDENEHSIRIFNGYEAAKWCYEHQLYQQALTIVNETIVTHVCCSLNKDWHDYDMREAVGYWLLYLHNKDKWDKKKLDKEKLESINIDPNILEEGNYTTVKLNNIFDWTNKRRNIYNHAGMTNNENIDKNTIEELGNKINSLIRLKTNDKIYH